MNRRTWVLTGLLTASVSVLPALATANNKEPSVRHQKLIETMKQHMRGEVTHEQLMAQIVRHSKEQEVSARERMAPSEQERRRQTERDSAWEYDWNANDRN